MATTLGDAAVPVDEFVLDEPVALLLGTEGHGLTAEWSDAAHGGVRIPMAAGIDSLNVATAAAICGWELRRRTIT